LDKEKLEALQKTVQYFRHWDKDNSGNLDKEEFAYRFPPSKSILPLLILILAIN